MGDEESLERFEMGHEESLGRNEMDGQEDLQNQPKSRQPNEKSSLLISKI